MLDELLPRRLSGEEMHPGKIQLFIRKYKAFFFAISTIYLFLILFPIHFQPIPADLDGSWYYAMNKIIHMPLSFGEDVIYTFGPLGFLVLPFIINGNYILSTLFLLLLHTIFIIFFLKTTVYISSIRQTLLAMLSFLLASIYFLKIEYFCLFTLMIVLLYSINTRKHFFSSLLITSILAAVFFYIRINTGIISYLCIFLFLFTIPRRKRVLLALAAIPLGIFIAFSALMLMLFYHNVGNWLQWLSGSMELMSNQNIAMSTEGTPLIYICATAIIILFIHTTFNAWRDKSLVLPAYLLLLIPLFFSFKHGLGRQDSHVMIFYSVCFVLYAFLFLLQLNRKTFIALSFNLGVLVLLSLPAGIINDSFTKHYLVRQIAGYEGIKSVVQVIQLDQTAQEYDTINRANFATRELPADWKIKLTQPGVKTDVLPWDLSYIPANGLAWQPAPFLQEYLIFTENMEQKTAEHFSSQQTPDYLIVSFKDIDQRNIFLDLPLTWSSILSNYQLAAVTQDQDLILMQHTAKPRIIVHKQLGESHYLTDEWIEVPNGEGFVLARMNLQYSLYGFLLGLFFHLPPLNLTIEYVDGRKEIFRLVPGILECGIVVNQIPATTSDFISILSGRSIIAVKRISVGGPARPCFNHEFIISWQTMQIQAANEPLSS
jgi:hypothetical protein